MIAATIISSLACSALTAWLVRRYAWRKCTAHLQEMYRNVWKIRWHLVSDEYPKCGKLVLVAYMPEGKTKGPACVTFTRLSAAGGFEIEQKGLGTVIAWAAKPKYIPPVPDSGSCEPVRASGSDFI